MIIDGYLLVDLLQNTCLFKTIESDQCANAFYESLDFIRIHHLKCHQLFTKNIQCMNKRPDVDNLLVKVTC